MPPSVSKKSSSSPRWAGLRLLRIIVATLVMAIFLLSFIDFRQTFPDTWGHYLAQLQFTPALQATLAGVVWPAAVILGSLLIGTLIFGRVYCSFLCPLGIYQDIVSRVTRLIRGKKYKAPRYAAPTKGVRMVFLFLFFAPFFVGLQSFVVGWLDPYSQFGRFANMFLRPAATEANNALVGTSDYFFHVPPQWAQITWLLIPVLLLLLMITVMSARRGRLYCNTICPVGALLGVISRFSAFRMTFDKGACLKCAQCLKACKAQCIDLRKNEIDYSRCVACFDCAASCDERGLRYRFTWKKTEKKAEKKTSECKGDCGCNSSLTSSGKKENPDSLSLKKAPASSEKVMSSLPVTSRRAFLGASALGALTTATAFAMDKKLLPGLKSKSSPRAISPPGSQSVEHFLDYCTACHLCLEACPTKCLRPAYMEYGAKGFLKPHLTFEKGFCNFGCTACADVCPAGAILPIALIKKQKTRIALANFNDQKCIVTRDKVDCGACSEHCPTKALDMVSIGEVITQPQCNLDHCARCNECFKACPEKAITLVDDPQAPGEKYPVIDLQKCIGCHKCIKVCEAGALTPRPSLMDLRIPKLLAESCIGCGACECACPVKAVVVSAIPVHEEAKQIVEEKVVNPNEGEDFPF